MSSTEMVSFPRELSDDLAELIATRARVCGGGAFEIWEAICEGFGAPASQRHDPIAWMVGTAIWWHKAGAERDSEERSEPMVPLGPCDSPSEIARVTAQFKEWQASHHRNYCKAADEREELRGQLDQARRLLHTASIRLANWLEPGDDPRKQIIAFLEEGAEPSTPQAPYPNRLCHTDYTAHPHRCGCLKGDEESQRIYDEHCHAALERQP